MKRAAFRDLESAQLGSMFSLYSGSFVARSTSCRVSIQPAAPVAGEDQRHHEQHRRDAANPALDARDQRREQKGEQRRERERNEEIAREIERGDDEGRQRDRPDADERIGGGGFALGRLHSEGTLLKHIVQESISACAKKRHSSAELSAIWKLMSACAQTRDRPFAIDMRFLRVRWRFALAPAGSFSVRAVRSQVRRRCGFARNIFEPIVDEGDDFFVCLAVNRITQREGWVENGGEVEG